MAKHSFCFHTADAVADVVVVVDFDDDVADDSRKLRIPPPKLRRDDAAASYSFRSSADICSIRVRVTSSKLFAV